MAPRTNHLGTRLLVLPALLGLMASATPAFGADTPGLYTDPGYYAGTVRITKILGPEGLYTTYTLPAMAKASADGNIAVMVTVPQSPDAAVDVGSTVVRFTPAILIYSMTHNYVADGKYPVYGGSNGKLLTLNYEVPPRSNPQNGVIIPTGTPVAVESKTIYEFKLRSRPAPKVPGVLYLNGPLQPANPGVLIPAK